MNRFLIGAASAALALAMAAPTLAAPAKKAAPAAGPVATQPSAARPAAPTAPAAAPPINHGPPVTGICIYSDDRAIGTSSAGKAASSRMQQLRAQVAAELQAEQTALQSDAAALNAKKATLTQDQLQAQAAPLNQRADALNAKANQRQRELEATGQEAIGQIHQKIDGILRGVYQQRGCSLLLNGDNVITGNPAMDVTDLVVQQLNVQLPTISFDRKILPAQAAPAQ